METRKFSDKFAIISLALLWGFSIWKIQLGMHSDEVHSIAIGDMIARGDAFFKESWFYLQMSAVFTAPVIKLFTRVTGGTEGVLFLFRILSVFIQTAICLYFYHTFKEEFHKKYTVAAAILLFTYIPDFQSFTYKQEIIWFTVMQIIFSYQYYRKRRKRYLVLLGLMIAGSVLAYPTSVLQFPLYLGILYWMNVDWGEGRISYIKDGVLISLICALCAGLFLAVVLQKISIGEFLRFFPKVFADDNLNTSFIRKLVHPFKKFVAMGMMTIVPLIICQKISWKKKDMNLLVITLLLWMAFGGQCLIERRGITWHCITYPYILSIFIVPILYWMRGRCKEERHILVLFEAPAITVIFCMALASNQGNITSMYGGIISMLALMLMLSDQNQDIERKTMGKTHILLVSSVLFFALVMYIIPVWEQESVDMENLGWRTIFTPRFYVHDGPAKGIYLGEKSYYRYNDLCDVVNEHVQKKDFLFIVDDAYMASYGYLCAIGEYATFSPQGGWGLATSDKAVLYFKDNPQKQPTIVLVNCNYIECGMDEYLETTPIGEFLRNGGYERIDDRNGYIVMRK